MIGILCNSKNEKTFIEYIQNALKKTDGNDLEIIVFSLQNIDLVEKNVSGNIISENEIQPAKVELPSLIFNFSKQYTRSNVKKLRYLMEEYDSNFVNSVNQFNQWAIMEMLSSGSKTKKYVLPFVDYAKEDVFSNFININNFILKPQNGSNLRKMIYGRQADSGFYLYRSFAKQFCNKLDIENGVYKIVQNGKWILLRTPNLLTYSDKLFVVRAYMQKDFDGDWKNIYKSTTPPNEAIHERFLRKIDTAITQIIDYIECYIPDLGFCYVDFVLDLYGSPFFLNFGGWDNLILGANSSEKIKEVLFDSIIDYSNSFINNSRL